MQISSVSFCGNKDKKEKIKNKGFNRACLAAGAIGTAASLPSIGILKKTKNISNISQEEIIELGIASKKGLKNTGLFEKGVRIHSIQENSTTMENLKKFSKNLVDLCIGGIKKDDNAKAEAIGEMETIIINLLKTSSKDKKALNALKEEAGCGNVIPEFLMFKSGSNACYLPKVNKIILPSKTLRTSVFHEMGHAMNNNGGIILKSLQKCRPLATLVPGIVLVASLLNKRPKGSEKADTTTVKGKIQNAADKVKKHAGLITGLSMLPMVLEEGIASLRGQGVAKKLVSEGSLSKELFKKVKATNLHGFTSYVAVAVGAVAACEAAIKIKDNIQKKYEAKRHEKIQAHQG